MGATDHHIGGGGAHWTSSAELVAGAVRHATRFGVDRAAALRWTGLRSTEGVGPKARIPAESVHAAIEEAVRVTGRDDLILEMIAGADLTRFGVLGFALRTSRTLAGAIARLVRFMGYWSNDFDLAVERRGEEFRLEACLLAPPRPGLHLLVAAVLGGVLHHGRRLCGGSVPVGHVALCCAEPRSVEAYERVFGARPSFGASVSSVLLRSSTLEGPLPQRDDGMAAFFDRHIEAAIEQLPDRTDEDRRRLDRVLSELLPEGEDVSLARVARRMGMSERTLQRRLSEEGTSFEAVLGDVRRRLAAQYLRSNLGIAQIGYAIGFSDTSSFVRAHRRWTGLTPGEARRRLHAGSR